MKGNFADEMAIANTRTDSWSTYLLKWIQTQTTYFRLAINLASTD